MEQVRSRRKLFALLYLYSFLYQRFLAGNSILKFGGGQFFLMKFFTTTLGAVEALLGKEHTAQDP
jgi:hypothetical protein